ncbi:MAG TPA: DUF3616 domain-containing protein [Clostridia bacterium]|nr:DUF3616 domain-containing protein [Clostridia bacterium]
MIPILIVSFLCLAAVARGETQATSPISFRGSCDASAAVALNEDLVAVADDEDNSIRVYSRHLGGSPIWSRELSKFLKVGPKSPEADLEGAARIEDRIYWISSHGRNAKGKARPSRGQFFATRITATNGTIHLEPMGQPYQRLLADLLREPQLARFDLRKASQLPPKSRGALNIEGLAATTNGQLLIGFRNPIPNGKALLVPLQNPSELLELKPARFGEPILLNLQGLGIRSITWNEERFLIVAGRFDEGGKSQLFEWEGDAQPPRRIETMNFRGLNPEAITCFANTQGPPELFVTSDDGTVEFGGKPCKDLKDPDQKCFRALSLTLSGVPR